MEQKAKLDSASEISSQYDAIQLNPKGVVQLMEAGEAPPFYMCVYTMLELFKQETTLTD